MILASGNRQEVTEGQVSKLLWSKGGFECSMGSELERTECAHWQSISRIVFDEVDGEWRLLHLQRLREHSQEVLNFDAGMDEYRCVNQEDIFPHHWWKIILLKNSLCTQSFFYIYFFVFTFIYLHLNLTNFCSIDNEKLFAESYV